MAIIIPKNYNRDVAEPLNVLHGDGLVFTGDADADKISVTLYNDGAPFSPGGTVVMNCIRADGNTVSVAGSISGNVASATLAQACCAIPGPLICVMQIVNGGTATVFAVAYTVEASSTGEAIDPGTTIQNITDLIADIDEAVASIPPDYSDLVDALYDHTTTEQFVAHNLANTSAYTVETYTGYSGNVGNSGITSAPRSILLEASGTYTSYCFIPAAAIDVYCDASSNTYYALSWLTDPANENWGTSGTSKVKAGATSTRLRKSSSDLPTESSPLTIPAGSQVVVTVKSGETPGIFIKQDVTTYRFKLRNLREFNPLMDVEMHSSGGSEYLYYYVQTDSGKYLRYKFNHWQSTGSGGNNGSGWVQRNVDLVSEDKSTVIFPIVTNGEWEMAVKISGRDDFIGCQNHGSEISTIVDLYFDGLKRTITDGASFQCSQIKVNQKSTMYDPADETTVVGYHYKTHIITADEIRIEQRIEWVHDEMLLSSYVMMMPAVRGNDSTSSTQVTDRAYDDHNMVESNVATTSFDPTSITGAIDRGHTLCLYGTTSGVVIDSSCSIKDRPASSFAFLSNAVYYNKWYFAYCGDNYAVHDGDVWEWVSTYKIRYNGE